MMPLPEVVSAWVAIPVSLLLVLAGALVLVGSLGLLRLSNFYQRLHGPAMINTLGAGSVLIASMLYFSALQTRPVVHELLITVFVLLTSPVTAMLLMRAAFGGLEPWQWLYGVTYAALWVAAAGWWSRRAFHRFVVSPAGAH